MERIFSFNKWFVFFCGFFVLVWLALQVVTNERVVEIAKENAQQVFSWQWPDMGWGEEANIAEAKVLKLTKTDAKVRIVGRQKSDSGEKELSATLTLYRQGRDWILGRVEFN